jgi:hypothetical protein
MTRTVRSAIPKRERHCGLAIRTPIYQKGDTACRNSSSILVALRVAMLGNDRLMLLLLLLLLLFPPASASRLVALYSHACFMSLCTD